MQNPVKVNDRTAPFTLHPLVAMMHHVGPKCRLFYS